MIRASEGNDHRTLGAWWLGHEQRHVARSLSQDDGQVPVGNAFLQERGRCLDDREGDVLLGCEPDDIVPSARRDERGRSNGDPPIGERGSRGVQACGLGCQVGLGGNEARDDQLVARLSDEGLAKIRESRDRRSCEGDEEHDPLRRLPLDEPMVSGFGEVEGGILREDRLLEPLERRARIDPELVGEDPAGRPETVEGVRLPAGAVQGQHVLCPEPLAEWMLGDKGRELGDDLRVTTAREIAVDPPLQDAQPEFLQAPDGGAHERLVDQVCQRGSSPELERLA